MLRTSAPYVVRGLGDTVKPFRRTASQGHEGESVATIRQTVAPAVRISGGQDGRPGVARAARQIDGRRAVAGQGRAQSQVGSGTELDRATIARRAGLTMLGVSCYCLA